MNKPVILISPQNKPMEAPYRGNYNYSNCYNTSAVIRAGGIPVIPPFLSREDGEQLMQQAQGLFLTGGADVSPELYGQTRQEGCGVSEPERDRSDFRMLDAALKFHKPVLCVCRGCQLGNVYFGGTLYQDLPAGGHRIHDEYWEGKAHRVQTVAGSPLEQLLGEAQFGVNSLHHQAVCRLAPGLAAMAYSEDGLVESWYLQDPEQWVRGYQWHPEMMESSARSQMIFQDFIRACQERMD